MANVTTESAQQFYGTGRRKSSVARVFLKKGSGKLSVNNRTLDNYFPSQTTQILALRPLEVANHKASFDIRISVKGGGISSQAGAISHGLARALMDYNDDLRKILRSAGLVTRDARVKERKKVGLVGARRVKQSSKR